jgi:phenylacetic acid degradation operon negative regulatory protein
VALTSETRPLDARASAEAAPGQLILTVYGLYAREHEGWLSVASIVRLLGDLGVDEQAVRSAISRLKRRGVLEAAKDGAVAGYRLSAPTREVLVEGDSRIFDRARATLADGWVMVVFSIPESQRDKRHTLRSRLTRLGFGTAAPGVWIAPGNLREETGRMLVRLGLDGYVDLFRADHLAFGDLAARVREWWDLDQLQVLYDEFLADVRPVGDQWSSGRRSTAREAFVDYVRVLTAWRRLPYLDPGLPPELLPAGWSGVEAADRFAELRARLAAPAAEHAASVTGADASRTGVRGVE